MKNQTRSIVFGDLSDRATNKIEELTGKQAEQVNGGNSYFNSNVNYQSNGPSGSYSYSNNNGEIQETGQRPAGFNPGNPSSFFSSDFSFPSGFSF